MRYTLYIFRQLARTVWKRLARKSVGLLFFLPPERKTALERRIRGREDFRKLQLTDAVVVSFGKSGRTWLRVLLSRIYQLKHDLPEHYLLGFDNLYYKNPAIPKIFFNHDNYLRDYTGQRDSKLDFQDKKVVLLVRDPRDVAVSQFFQWKHRMRPHKKALNDYPADNAALSLFDFMTDSAGLPKVIDFMNGWAEAMPQLPRLLLVRYEDLRAQPEAQLKRLLDFLETPATAAQIQAAVAFASYDNMKKMEQKQVFWLSGGRLVPKDRNNPDSFKVRRAKVGGYRDYFQDSELTQIDALMQTSLAPVFGYTTPPEPTTHPAVSTESASSAC